MRKSIRNSFVGLVFGASSSDYSNEIMVCDDDGTQNSYYRYDSTDSDANNVDASGLSIDQTYEITC